MNVIAERIKAIRQMRKLSQKALAEMAGISVTTLNHIERGDDCSLSTIDKIADALGTRLY